MSYVPQFTQADADEFAASVADMLPHGLKVFGQTFDAGNYIGIGVQLPDGMRHAVATPNPYEGPDAVAAALNDWLAALGAN